MNILCNWLLLTLTIKEIFCTISITKVVVRIPKEHDIGLIFDLLVLNNDVNKKEMLEFRVRSDGTCYLNLTNSNDEIMTDASRIVGGNFGYIQAGEIETVSLIWPTVSLYNRVGCCPISITTTSATNELKTMKQILHFDTTFTTLDPEGNTLRKHKDYKDCNNWDKEYMKNCTPVNCEERYFGRRNFYNVTTERCEPVPMCCESYQIYDLYANECIDTRNFCTEEDIQNIRDGKFEENILDLHESCSSPTPNIVVNEPKEIYQYDNNREHRREAIDINDDIINEDFLTAADAKTTQTSVVSTPEWVKGLANGVLIVLASISIYVLICFAIFLIVSWISRRHKRCEAKCKPSPRPATDDFTPSSVLSQR